MHNFICIRCSVSSNKHWSRRSSRGARKRKSKAFSKWKGRTNKGVKMIELEISFCFEVAGFLCCVTFQVVSQLYYCVNEAQLRIIRQQHTIVHVVHRAYRSQRLFPHPPIQFQQFHFWMFFLKLIEMLFNLCWFISVNNISICIDKSGEATESESSREWWIQFPIYYNLNPNIRILSGSEFNFICYARCIHATLLHRALTWPIFTPLNWNKIFN